MKRIISLLIVLMMVFGVFSVMISASAASTINTVRINDLTEPTAGGTPDYTATVGLSTAYEIDYIDWYDKTAKKFLKEGDKFVAGHTYQLQVYIDSKSGYEFKTNSNGTAAVDAFLNGKSVTATKTDGTVAWARVAIYYDFEVVNYITTVSVYNITEPVAGGTPDYTGTAGHPAYEIDYIDWYDKTDKKFLKSGDKFKPDHTYQLQVFIDIADFSAGYEFKTNSDGTAAVSGLLNAKSVTVSKTDGTAAWARVAIFHEFTLDPIYITDVSVTNITEPAAGKTPDYTGTVGNSAYEIGYLEWYDKNAKRFLKEGDTFIAGHTYQLQVFLDIADFSTGHEFKTNSNGTPAVTGKINGKTVTVSKEDTTAAWARVAMYYEYTLDPNYITNVAVSDIDVPTIGKTPDYTGKVGNSAYEIGYLEWYDKTAKKFLKSGDKFVAGHTYELQVFLDLSSMTAGYEFKTNSNGTPAVTGKINGKTVTVSKEDTTAAWARVAMRLEYALEANKILDVSVSGINVPKVGGTPDYEGVVGNSAYEIGYLEWYDKTTKKFLKDGDKFEDGHTYQLQIFLDVANLSDTEFATNSNGTPNVTAKINGTPVEAVKEDTTAAFARVALYYDFVVSSTATSTTAPDSSIGETTTTPENETTTAPEDETTTTTTPDKSDKNDKNDKNDNTNKTNDDGGLDLWVILAIAGGVVVVAAVVVVIIIVSKKKK